MYSPKLIVDIGANIGAFSLAAKNRFPGAQVHAYEPSRNNFLKLRENINMNNLSVECFNLAVAEKDSTRLLFHADTTGKHSFFGEGEKEEVNCTTLDAIISKTGNVDLLKMDIEGAEEEVLSSSSKLSSIKRIALEFHSNEDKVLPILERAGFVPISQVKHGVQVFSHAK